MRTDRSSVPVRGPSEPPLVRLDCWISSCVSAVLESATRNVDVDTLRDAHGRLHRRLRWAPVLTRLRHALRRRPAALAHNTPRPPVAAAGRRTARTHDHPGTPAVALQDRGGPGQCQFHGRHRTRGSATAGAVPARRRQGQPPRPSRIASLHTWAKRSTRSKRTRPGHGRETAV